MTIILKLGLKYICVVYTYVTYVSLFRIKLNKIKLIWTNLYTQQDRKQN